MQGKNQGVGMGLSGEEDTVSSTALALAPSAVRTVGGPELFRRSSHSCVYMALVFLINACMVFRTVHFPM